MCGISGIIAQGVQPEKAGAALQRMTDALAHRGPDAEGVWNNGHAYLGHRRLSIIDLSEGGRQPMFSYDKRYAIVYNGELYNYRELRLQLQRAVQGTSEQPYFFKTQSDTEVILAAYMRWGKDCLARFNGMFAFAIYDTITRTLFIARDRLGIKPLYYAELEKDFLFASEVRSLLKSGLVDKTIDRASLVDYLRYQTVHAPATIFSGIKMLMPGHFLWLENGRLELQSWWKAEKSISAESEGKSYEQVCADIKRLFYAAVERRLVADVPFGAFLSGGIDSSAVVGAMASVSTQQTRTFSVVFDESEYSEARYSRLVAKKFNTDHHEIRLTPEEFLGQVPEALAAMDHPSGDGPNTYIVSKATRRAGITMALSGLGSDELFAGYDIFKRSYRLERQWWLNLFPRMLRVPAAVAIGALKNDVASKKVAEILAKPLVNFNYAYPVSRQVLPDKRIRRLLDIHDLPMNQVYRHLRLMEFSSKSHRLSKYSLAELGTYMQNTLLRDTDQMSMAVALEVRVPFLDYKLVEYVLGVKDAFKYPHTPKKLLVDALGDLLPAEIIHRKKMGFVLPWALWMKNELRPFCRENLSGLSEIGFNQKEINKLWSDFEKGDPTASWSRIWPLVALGSYQNNI
jgi:asparagine synthase (glutamine-hydrolysing)